MKQSAWLTSCLVKCHFLKVLHEEIGNYKELVLISILVLLFSHHFITLPLPFSQTGLLGPQFFISLSFCCPIWSNLPSLHFTFFPPSHPKFILHFIVLHIYTHRQVHMYVCIYVCMYVMYVYVYIQFPISLHFSFHFLSLFASLLSCTMNWEMALSRVPHYFSALFYSISHWPGYT
jgi:hypothetical protein